MALDPDIEAKYVHNGKVMLGSAILLFILILLIIFYRTYAHICIRRRRRHLFPNSISTATSFSTPAAAISNERLDPSVLKSLPTFTFSSAAHRPLHDCAVCLSEFEDGEKGRVLPNCGHAFHTSCIDMWFGSHSNCPLCRATVQPATSSATVEACSVSVTEAVEEVEVGGCSSLPPPVMCSIKPLSVMVELPEQDRGLDHYRVLSLKRFCSV